MAAPEPQTIIGLPLSASAVAFLDLVAQRQGWTRENVIEAAIADFIDDWRPLVQGQTDEPSFYDKDSRTGHAAALPPKPD